MPSIERRRAIIGDGIVPFLRFRSGSQGFFPAMIDGIDRGTQAAKNGLRALAARASRASCPRL
jgi:hypothetical protein